MDKWLWVILLMHFPLSAGWLDRKAEGWAWYEEDEKKQYVEEVSDEVEVSAIAQLETVKKNLEALFAEALLQPTQENVVNYLEAQKVWMEKSADFAGRWGKVLLARPDLDPTATTYATTQYGRQLQKTLEQEEKTRLIKDVAGHYGLLLFYEGGSKTSKAFAGVVRAFADKYSWEVVGVSTDGYILPEIGGEVDSGLVEKLGVAILPALIAYDPITHAAVPLAFGLKSLDQIENNIAMQLKTRE